MIRIDEMYRGETAEIVSMTGNSPNTGCSETWD